MLLGPPKCLGYPLTFNPIMTYLRPSEADILFWDNHPHRELHKRFFDDNAKKIIRYTSISTYKRVYRL